MAVSKVDLANGEVLIDLTGDSATESVVFEGAIFHGADGEVKTGTFTITEEITQQDSLIEQIKAALKGKATGGGVSEPTTISGVNLHDTETDTPNTYLQGATVKTYNGWTTTDFIPVEDGKFYLAYSASAIDSKYCSKFNANKAGASSLAGTVNCTDKNRPIFLSGHDGYFRFSGTAAQIAALEFYEVINFNWEV